MSTRTKMDPVLLTKQSICSSSQRSSEVCNALSMARVVRNSDAVLYCRDVGGDREFL